MRGQGHPPPRRRKDSSFIAHRRHGLRSKLALRPQARGLSASRSSHGMDRQAGLESCPRKNFDDHAPFRHSTSPGLHPIPLQIASTPPATRNLDLPEAECATTLAPAKTRNSPPSGRYFFRQVNQIAVRSSRKLKPPSSCTIVRNDSSGGRWDNPRPTIQSVAT